MELFAGDKRVGVLGATSLVGACLLPLLAGGRWKVVAFSRGAGVANRADGPSIEWRRLRVGDSGGMRSAGAAEAAVAYWVCLAPIWVLPDYFGMLERCAVRRVVALSSTSVLTKGHSADATERALAHRLAHGESRLLEWGQARGIEVMILRSTLIYGLGRDKNISAIARFIRRFGFFPLVSPAQGLRQPVHAADVASACVAALQLPHFRQSAYELSGGETLTYRDMVARVFAAMHMPARFLPLPAWAFRLAVAGLRVLPRLRHWSPEMARRMNTDLVFSHSEAARDLAFAPRGFALAPEDLPAR